MTDEPSARRPHERASHPSLDDRLATWLSARVRAVIHHRKGVAAGILAATLLALPWTALHLGVDSDTMHLLSPALPFVKRHAEFIRLFPGEANPIYVLVESKEPDLAREAARTLTRRLGDAPALARSVYWIGGDPFFERHGLLYRSVDDLEDMVDELSRVQPFLTTLEADPRLATLVKVLERGLDASTGASEDMAPFFDHIRDATVQVFAPVPIAPSWADLLLAGSAFEPPTPQVLVVDPVLDFDSPLAGTRALDGIRGLASGLPGAESVRVRITGQPALNAEEMRGLEWDVGVSSIASFALVVGLLWLALRSGRLVTAAGATLVAGLIWTSTFATVAVGRLNLVSMTFAVLFIGLGIDFSIHLLLHALEDRPGAGVGRVGLVEASRQVGTSLVLCAMTTSIGFLAFLPTDYRGVAQLGLIAGVGMLVILALTFTLLPALTGAAMPPARTRRRRALAVRVASLRRRVAERPGRVVGTFAALAAVSAAVYPRVHFDSDVIGLRDPDTESVRAFQDLIATGGDVSPWQVDVLAADLADADTLAGRLRKLSGVEAAVTLSDLVPTDQPEKLEILEDADLFMEPPPPGPPAETDAEPVGAEAVSALRRLDGVLARAEPRASGRLADSMHRLREAIGVFLERAAADGDPRAAAARLEKLLFGELKSQLQRLRTGLETGPVTLADIPPALASRMRATDGRFRVQVIPKPEFARPDALAGFVDEVLAVAPEATGSAVDVVEFGRTTSRALQQAMVAAFVAIAALVWLLWRRISDVACALAPLALAALLTIGAMAGLGLSFNFANAIVLPLLLGVGVDSGIHLVHRWRTGELPGLGTSATERAIAYSALTTIASFGNLAFSGHRGIASLGMLLTLGLLVSLACNLVFLPALLALRSAPRRS